MRKFGFVILVLVVLMGSAALMLRSPSPGTLTVAVTEGFVMKPELLAQFERETGAKVILQKFADAEAMLTQPITADVAYGIDTFTYARAINKNIFGGYAAPQLAAVPQRLKTDAQNRLLPIAVNYVTINYDQQYFANLNRPPPKSLRELTDRKLYHKFVIVSPEANASDIGLAFLALTVASFPEGSAYPWQQYWRDLLQNALHPVMSWNEAYGAQFSATQPAGTDVSALHALCLSYAGAPAADMHFNKRAQPVMGNVGDVGFELVTYVGINKNTQARTLAQKFVDVLLSQDYQREIAPQRFAYPARSDVPLPANMAPPANPLTLPPEVIEQNRARWLSEWRHISGGG
jgi:ABC transporter substrate-binding protein (ThiB subfamily)